MMLFPKAPFLVTNFPKIIKNSIFLLNFHQKFSTFSRKFPTICVFRPNARKINAWFVKFIWKICKNNAFLAIFLRKFLQIFDNSPASGGLRLMGGSGAQPPGRPTRPTPKSVSPRTKILATPRHCFSWKAKWSIRFSEQVFRMIYCRAYCSLNISLFAALWSVGIGRALSEELIQRGAHVICVSRTAEDLDSLKKLVPTPSFFPNYLIYSIHVSHFTCMPMPLTSFPLRRNICV